MRISRNAAVDACRILLMQTTPILTRACSARTPTIDCWRLAVSQVRDLVDNAARHRVEYGSNEDHEELYLPLVDSLSHLNAALMCPLVDARQVRLAFNVLRDLERLLEVTAHSPAMPIGGVA